MTSNWLSTARLSGAVVFALQLVCADVVAQTAPATNAPVIRPTAPITRPALPAPTVRPRTAAAETLQRTPQPGEDLDGDGSVSALVGGDDCDDQNPQRYPGATEIANALDEDCDLQSIGEGGLADQDGDGFVSAEVYNPGGRGGDDCNDLQATINRHAQELPNRIDDNCDGEVDNLLGTWWTPQ